MKLTCILVAIPALLLAGPASASEDEAFTHALTLVQTFVHAAAQSGDPQAGLRAIDDVLAGRNSEANRALAGLLEEATAGMSSEHKDQVASIGRDIAALARQESARTSAAPQSTDAALQARKDLAGMGLRYFDQEQFLDAVRRDDALAVELYFAGRGVNASAKGGDGRTALEIARGNGNAPMQALIARNLPAAR